MNIIARDLFGVSVGQQNHNGYFNATKLSQSYYTATGKRRDVSEWLSNKRTKESIAHLASVTGKSATELVVIRQGGDSSKEQGTWIHPDLVSEFEAWLLGRSNEKPEKMIQIRLFAELGGQMEVITPAGAIDLLTSTTLIEIKHIKHWKSGVGQLLVFGVDYPEHQKRLHLFGSGSSSFWGIVDRYCKPLDICVTEER
jgi:hypothetical protein